MKADEFSKVFLLLTYRLYGMHYIS